MNRREQFKNYIATNQTQKKIVDHIKAHKTEYSCLVTGIVVAGFTGIIVKGRYAVAGNTASDGPVRVTVRPFTFFSKTGDIVTVIVREGRGHPGYMIRCLETLEEFMTQNDAARSAGISSKGMSWHLNGKLPDANGLHYERIAA